jgi:CheY-like chemotaxis protein
MQVAEADSFDETLSELRDAAKSGRHFDLALIDHRIHGRSGLDLARAIRLEKDIASVRLVLLSTFGQRPSEEMISEVGIRALLTKPVRQSQLYDCLVSVMEDKFLGKSNSASRLPPVSVGQSFSPERVHNQDRRLNGNPRLLVVEDNPINQQVARYQIEKIGYPVDVVKDGAAALAILDQHDYALILMDCHMPGMDGFEATARIRQRADHKRGVPIIAVTASGTTGEREKCLQAGMNDFLLKPFREEELAGKIAAWLPHDRSASRAAGAPNSSAGEIRSGVVKDVTDRLSELEADYGKEMVLKIVEMIVPDTEARIDRIDRAIQQKDFRALEEAAHGLKSGAANIGATKLAQLSEDLEARGEVKSIGDAEEVVKKLRESWTEVRVEIARYR